MKLYPRTFVNPLLALAFKEGVDFVADPEYKALEPKREGDKWTVIVEHDDDDDDDDGIVIHATSNTVTPDRPKTIKELEERFSKMKPVTAKSAPGSVPSVVVSATEPDDEPEPLPDPPTKGCGQCVPCSTGHDCIRDIEAACRAMNGRER